jgi:hypothetical protein
MPRGKVTLIGNKGQERVERSGPSSQLDAIRRDRAGLVALWHRAAGQRCPLVGQGRTSHGRAASAVIDP